MIKDSGERRDFGTGAVRDCAAGKGRCDLLPLDIVSNVVDFSDGILHLINNFIRNGVVEDLYNAIEKFSRKYFDNVPNAMLEVAIHMEEGCNKYGERNFENGIPLHCYIDSGVRHYLKFLRGDTDERHDRAFLWNMICGLWTLKNKSEMNDLPFADNKVKE